MSDGVLAHPDPSARLVDAYRAVHASRMAGLPLINPALEVEAVAFAPWTGRWLGVMVTPWFMNLVLLPCVPAHWIRVPRGDKRMYRFPAGDYEFIGGEDEGIGEYQTCSLFSPMHQFDDQHSARLVARLAREALFDPANAEARESFPANAQADKAGPLARLEANLDAPLSKRDFLRGRFGGGSHDDRR